VLGLKADRELLRSLQSVGVERLLKQLQYHNSLLPQ
jgi:hypothetical protein